MKNKYQFDQLKKRLILILFGAKIFSLPIIYKIRIFFYRKVFNIDVDPIIEHGVWIQKTHSLDGKIEIGKRVLFGKNISIDYSGSLTIEDDVWLSENCSIHTHNHIINKKRINRKKNSILSNKILLKKGCWIGANAILLASAKEIGENSIVAAGAVVTKPVPKNVIVAGNPAKIIKKIDNE